MWQWEILYIYIYGGLYLGKSSIIVVFLSFFFPLPFLITRRCIWMHMQVSKNRGTPRRIFHYKPTIFGGPPLMETPIVCWQYTGWFVGIPLLDYCSPQYMKGSIIPELIMNQQGFSSHCSSIFTLRYVHIVGNLTSKNFLRSKTLVMNQFI